MEIMQLLSLSKKLNLPEGNCRWAKKNEKPTPRQEIGFPSFIRQPGFPARNLGFASPPYNGFAFSLNECLADRFMRSTLS
jgi:hypothetical protein